MPFLRPLCSKESTQMGSRRMPRTASNILVNGAQFHEAVSRVKLFGSEVGSVAAHGDRMTTGHELRCVILAPIRVSALDACSVLAA